MSRIENCHHNLSRSPTRCESRPTTEQLQTRAACPVCTSWAGVTSPARLTVEQTLRQRSESRGPQQRHSRVGGQARWRVRSVSSPRRVKRCMGFPAYGFPISFTVWCLACTVAPRTVPVSGKTPSRDDSPVGESSGPIPAREAMFAAGPDRQALMDVAVSCVELPPRSSGIGRTASTFSTLRVMPVIVLFVSTEHGVDGRLHDRVPFLAAPTACRYFPRQGLAFDGPP